MTSLAQQSRPGGSPCQPVFNDVASGQDRILDRFRHAVIRPAPDRESKTTVSGGTVGEPSWLGRLQKRAEQSDRRGTSHVTGLGDRLPWEGICDRPTARKVGYT